MEYCGIPVIVKWQMNMNPEAAGGWEGSEPLIYEMMKPSYLSLGNTNVFIYAGYRLMYFLPFILNLLLHF